MSRVVVTGLGLITALGNDLASSWKNLCLGRSGVREITSFDTGQYRVHIGAEIADFDPSPYMSAKDIRRSDPYEHLAVAAARQALTHAEFKITQANAHDVGVCVGSSIGGIVTMHEQFRIFHEKGPQHISPFCINMTIPDGATGIISILTGAKGPIWATVSACATGANAIGQAWDAIRQGNARAMIAGGAEKAIVPICVAAFDNIHSLSRRNCDPERASRPFDATRDGFVLGEGTGMLILEDLEFAQARGANILAEIVGYASVAEAYHVTSLTREAEGLTTAMRKALRKAKLLPKQVDYISAHGTSTPCNDATETRAIKQCFGEHAGRLSISSNKSMIGHTLGAAGAINAVTCIMTMRTGIIPPTINLHSSDPECDLDYVPNEARRANVNVAMSNSMGFGGHNACLVFRQYEK